MLGSKKPTGNSMGFPLISVGIWRELPAEVPVIGVTLQPTY